MMEKVKKEEQSWEGEVSWKDSRERVGMGSVAGEGWRC